MTILVDADACPVKDQIYAAAYRHQTPVRLYAASYLRHPEHPLISMITAGDAFDAADDRIVEDAGPGMLVLTHRGEVLDASNIGAKLATRDLLADLRGGLEGQGLGGPRAFSKADRSAFAQAIETALRKL